MLKDPVLVAWQYWLWSRDLFNHRVNTIFKRPVSKSTQKRGSENQCNGKESDTSGLVKK